MAAVELVVTDLDGTFWDAAEEVSPSVLAAVAELERRGMPLLVATGRRVASTRGPLGRAGLTPPAVVLNGAMGLHLGTLERFHLAPYPAAEALMVYDAFVGAGVSPVVYVDHPRYDVFISDNTSTHPDHVRQLGDTAARRPGPTSTSATDDLRAAVAEEAVLGFGVIGFPFEAAEAAFAALSSIAEPHLDRSIEHPALAAMTVAPRNQSKWDGVVAYCAAHGIDSTKVMAVADGPNDIELLTNAAMRVVPQVAHPSALELATAVIASAEDAGWSEVPSLLD
jgi:hydroxymethylpyrimidine pyrophosphatase-like HAD family hydrolase